MKYSIFFFAFFLSSLGLSAQSDSLCTCPDFADYQYRSLEDALADVEGAKSLDLAMRSITTVSPDIGRLENLESLDLSFNRIPRLPEEFANLKNLRCLKIVGCRYLAGVPEIIKELPNLECLYIGDHPEWKPERFQEAVDMLPGVNVIW